MAATVATAAGAAPAFAADVQPPTRPGTLTQTPIDFGVVRLTWGASSDDVGVTSYDILDGAAATVLQTVNGASTEAVFSAPVYGPLGYHQLRVVARDAAGNVSPESNWIGTSGCSFDMYGAVQPANFVASNITSDSATISWVPGTLTSWCHHATTGFEVRVNGQAAGSVAADQSSFRLTSLKPGATVHVSVVSMPLPMDVDFLTPPIPVTTTEATPTPTPTPTDTPPVDCGSVSESTQVAYGYDLAGSATLKTLVKGSLPLKGGIAAELGVPSGCFTADLTLAQTTGNLTALGFLPVTAVVQIVPTEKVTGQLKAGVLKANAKVRIKLPKVSLFGIQLGGGSSCQAKQISSIALQSTQAQFFPLAGGPIAGTFSISDLAGCGALNGIISPLTAGKGNAILLNLTPKV